MAQALLKIYNSLLNDYGRQAWWPTHRSFQPKEWEICVGAILTQNTNWRNVEKALDVLLENKIISPEKTLGIKTEELEKHIRSSGFYRQKAIRLRTLAQFILSFGSFSEFNKKVKREELLKVKGIGPETCDSILLYACNRPFFVIDAYTRRFVRSLGMKTKQTKAGGDYESLRSHFEARLPRDVALYKEFHALIVEWGKR